LICQWLPSIKFFVKDTGKGISESNLKLIFDQFIKGQENKNENFYGAGLGLAILQGILNFLDGKI